LAVDGQPFTPWGFNYDHDEHGELLEQYWHRDWNRVVEDFKKMKALGANVVRIHLQFGAFFKEPGKPQQENQKRLKGLLQVAEELELWLDITGLGCYFRKLVPSWYDRLSETERWEAQRQFWRAVASVCAESPAVFCYDLMNEPVVPGEAGRREDWLGPPFAGKYHFVQFVALDTRGRARRDIARAWTRTLVRTIREVDPNHLITVGLVPWSLPGPGLTSGFEPAAIAPELDFLAVHIYPTSHKLNEDLETVRRFSETGKPVVLEEIFPLGCTVE
jgi:hypothetical protein